MTINEIIQQSLDAHKEGKLDEAEKLYLTVLQTDPLHAGSNHNLGVIALSKNKIELALPFFRTATKANPNIEHFWVSYINALIKKNDLGKAETNSKKAITLNPNFSNVHSLLANILLKLKRLNEAEIYFRQVIQLNPKSAEAQNNLGVLLQELNKENEAEVCFKQAIQIKSDFGDAHYNLGLLSNKMKRTEEAELSLDRAKKLNPDIDYLLGTLLHTKMNSCKWDNLPANVNELKEKIKNGKKVTIPFSILSLIDDPSIHRKSAEIYSYDRFPKSYVLPKISSYRGHKKIKIGYFSPNFNNHPVSYLTAELYETHDRKKFEIHAFSFKEDTNDEFNIRVKAGVDYFHNVSNLSDLDAVTLARSLEIDIAIDLAGYTEGNRANIFAMSVAPIQVGYIGYLGTMGSDYHDYLIADKIIIPEQNKKYYSENIIYLPSYQVNDSQKFSHNLHFRRQDFNIPEDSFVFCCFNNTYKINPDVFNCWARILKQVDNSVLMLFTTSPLVIENLKIQIKKRKIDPSRLIFVKKLDRLKYLARYQVVDLFLDTFPYNAGTIASDALRMEVPVLTYLGKSFASRMGASLLNALDLPELIAITKEEYELLGITLATNKKKFNIIKEKLKNSLPTSRLYNTPLFTKYLEDAYLIINEKYQDGLKPEDLEINY
tara:strand:+ start:3908 stop:5884 length:1977 start_codon:yes stop_codon:yes gene_type:complete